MAMDDFRLRAARAVPGVMQGVLKIQRDPQTGKILFAPAIGGGAPVESAAEAMSYIESQYGLTGHYSFKDAKFRSTRQSQFLSEVHEHLRASKGGGHLEVFEYKFTSSSQAEALRETLVRDGQEFGWLVPDVGDSQARVVRMYDARGREKTGVEVRDYLEKNFGYMGNEPLDSKFAKRESAFVAMKQFEMMDAPLKVGVYDASVDMDLSSLQKEFAQRARTEPQYLAAEIKRLKLPEGSSVSDVQKAFLTDAANTASDGMVRGSREMFEAMVKSYGDMHDALSVELEKFKQLGDQDAVRQIMREMDQVKDDIKRLQGVIDKKAGIFNIRASGFQVQGIGESEEISKIVQDMNEKGYLIKGNVSYEDQLRRKYGVDILVNQADPTMQAGVAPLHAAARPTLTLAMHEAGDVLIDFQSMASLSNFFTTEFIQEGGAELRGSIEAAVDAVRRGEEPPAAFMSILESMAEGTNPGNRAAARNMLYAIEHGMPIADDPVMMQEIIDAASRSTYRKKGQRLGPNGELIDNHLPKIPIPNAVRAEVVSHHVYKDYMGVRKMEPGEIQYHARSGTLIMHETDIVRHKATFGGFDLDDALINIFRMEEDGKIQSLVYRQPNAMGEHTFFRMHLNDDLIVQAVRKHGNIQQYKNGLKSRDKWVKQIKKQKGKLRQDRMKMERTRNKVAEIRNRRDEKWGSRSTSNREAARLDREIAALDEQLIQLDRQISKTNTNISHLETRLEDIEAILADAFREAQTGVDPTGRRVADPAIRSTDDFKNVVSGRRSSEKIYIADAAGRPTDKFRFAGDPTDVVYTDVGDAAKQIDIATGKIKDVFTQLGERAGKATDLARYSNARMFYDSWIQTHAGLKGTQVWEEVMSKAAVEFVEMEKVIDTTLAGEAFAEKMDNVINRLYEVPYEAAIRAQQLDPGTLDFQIDPGDTDRLRASIGARDRLLAEIDSPPDVRSLEMSREIDEHGRVVDPRARGLQVQHEYQMIRDINEKLSKQHAVPGYEGILDQRAVQDARRAVGSYMDQIRAVGADVDMDSIDRIYERRRAGLNILESLARTTFDEGMATERTYKTILAMHQMAEDSINTRKMLKILHEVGTKGGLSLEAINWGRAKVADEVYTGPLTIIDDIEETIGSVTRSTLFEQLQSILDPETFRSLREVSEAVEIAGDAGIPLPGRKGKLPSPFSPDLPVGESSLGEILLQQRTASVVSEEALDEVRNTMSRFVDTAVSDEVLQHTDLPPYARDRLLEARAPGAGKAAQAQRAADDAASIASASYRQMSAMDFMKTQPGKMSLGGLGLIAAASIMHSVRTKDRSPEDLEGPSLPGGGAYEQASPMPMSFNSGRGGGQQGGVTYQVQTQGGEVDPALLGMLSDFVGGGDVNATTHNKNSPFSRQSSREQFRSTYGR